MISEETRQKLREAKLKNPVKYWLGKKRTITEKTKQKLRASNIGKHHTVETKRKLSLFRTGMKYSEETKKRISQSKKGKIINEFHPNFKKFDYSYSAIHKWVILRLGKASYCSNNPRHKRKIYYWANISGDYKRNLNDWHSLCASCNHTDGIKIHPRFKEASVLSIQ